MKVDWSAFIAAEPSEKGAAMRPTLHSPIVGICRYLAPALLLLMPVSGWAQNVIATVAVGTNPIAVAVNPVTNKITNSVANCLRPFDNSSHGTSGTVTVIDGNSHATTEVPTGVCPTAVAVNSVSNKIYVANFGRRVLFCISCSNLGSVTIIDGRTNAAITIADPNASFPQAVAVNPATNKIYVANKGSSNVTVIDGVNNSIRTVWMPQQSNPYNVAVNPVTNRVYVSSSTSSSSGDTTLFVIDGATNVTTPVIDPLAIYPVEWQ